MTRRVLFISHNHPSIRPGGAENYAVELADSFRAAGEDVILLAKGGAPLGRSGRVHEGTIVTPIDGRSDEYFFFTEPYVYDWLNGTITDKDFYTLHFRRFLEAVRPDVVHLQHALFLGYDVLREIRTTLPDAVIVYTLHEFSAICHRDGQMVRTFGHDELCDHANARRCHECFPEISPQDFFLRERFIKGQFEMVDTFVTPSRFLRDRFVAWGLDPGRILHEPNGRVAPPAVARPSSRERRTRFGFFGQITRFKGLDVLLEAMALLRAETSGTNSELADLVAALGLGPTSGAPAEDRPHLWVHGANLDLQLHEYREHVGDLLAATSADVTLVGAYRPEQLPELMEEIDWVVVPSIWWENAPLVIQEAFTHGRPVICSDIGGMAEKVTDGVDGLHFRARDPRSLAATIQRASTEPGLWDQLAGGISPTHDMDDHRTWLSNLYGELARRPRAGRVTEVPTTVRSRSASRRVSP